MCLHLQEYQNFWGFSKVSAIHWNSYGKQWFLWLRHLLQTSDERKNKHGQKAPEFIGSELKKKNKLLLVSVRVNILLAKKKQMVDWYLLC
jgi:hypothetical protein